MRSVLIAVALIACGGEQDDAACTIGEHCGNDCLANNDACWACGELAYDADCQCRPVASTCFRPDCTSDTPGAAGDYCGTYWWCDRPCADGLQCLLEDATPGSYLQTCQVPGP